MLIVPSVPIPLNLYPPKGISKLLKKLAPLITVPPHSNFLTTLNAVLISFVNTQPDKPYLDAFAILIASSTVSNGIIETTGPKISSSVATSAVLGISVMIVGAINEPFL